MYKRQGIYYLTLSETEDLATVEEEVCDKRYGSIDEVIMAYETGVVGLHDMVLLRHHKEDGSFERIVTTPGRCIFNQVLPQGLRFANEVIDRKLLNRIVSESINRYGMEAVSYTHLL